MQRLDQLDGARQAMQRAAWLMPSDGFYAVAVRSLDAEARAAGLPALPPPFGVIAPPLFEQPRGMTVTGRALSDGDRPFAGWVQLASRGDYMLTRLDEHGVFRARALPGDIELAVFPDAADWVADRFEHRVKFSLQSVDLGVHRVTSEAPRPHTAFDGIATSSWDGRVIVWSVQKDSPAATAGVLRGDVLLSIDGRSVAGFGEHGVNALLAGAVGVEKTLVLQSGLQPSRTVRFQLAPQPSMDSAPQE
jgi:hypothetical protein